MDDQLEQLTNDTRRLLDEQECERRLLNHQAQQESRAAAKGNEIAIKKRIKNYIFTWSFSSEQLYLACKYDYFYVKLLFFGIVNRIKQQYKYDIRNNPIYTEFSYTLYIYDKFCFNRCYSVLKLCDMSTIYIYFKMLSTTCVLGRCSVLTHARVRPWFGQLDKYLKLPEFTFKFIKF